MAVRKPKVVVTRKLPEPIEARLAELFDTVLNHDDLPMSAGGLAQAMAEADVLVPTVTDRIDRALIEGAGEQLKLIANFGAGVDHIDVEAALARGITVTNTPGVLDRGHRRHRHGADHRGGPAHGGRRQRSGGRRLPRLVADLDDGAAAQGQAARHRRHGPHRPGARPPGEGLRHGDPLPQPQTRLARGGAELGATYWESLDQLLAHADVVSLNCPHTPATYHLLSARRLKLMQPEAVLVNTARGGVVDEAALADMLERGELAGAGLDVYEREPTINPKLLTLPNVVLTPHLASATVEARIDMGQKVLVNIHTFTDGHRPPDRVLLSML